MPRGKAGDARSGGMRNSHDQAAENNVSGSKPYVTPGSDPTKESYIAMYEAKVTTVLLFRLRLEVER